MCSREIRFFSLRFCSRHQVENCLTIRVFFWKKLISHKFLSKFKSKSIALNTNMLIFSLCIVVCQLSGVEHRVLNTQMMSSILRQATLSKLNIYVSYCWLIDSGCIRRCDCGVLSDQYDCDMVNVLYSHACNYIACVRKCST